MLLFETIKIIDGIPINLEYHQNRLEKSMRELFHTSKYFQLNELIIPENIAGKVKCKFQYSENCFFIEYSKYTAKKINSLKILNNESIEYQHKFTNREKIEKLVDLKSDFDDIMIAKNGFITDSSFANLAFFDGKKYFTPDTFLLNGTKRQFLLASGLIEEISIKVDDIQKYHYIKLINAMLDLDESKEIYIIG